MENFYEFLGTDTKRDSTVPQTRSHCQSAQNGSALRSGADSKDEELIFVTYSWESDEHKDRIVSLTDHLRKTEGFNALMDQMILQDQTAADLNKMMYTYIHNASKVIAVLSRGYKQKAAKG